MKKFLLLFLCLCMIPLPVFAQEAYDMVYPFENGFARVVRNDKWGLINEDLSLAEELTWDYVGEISENRRMVKKDGKYGFLNHAHKVAVEPIYIQVGNFYENRAAAMLDEGQWGFIDPEGGLPIPCIYEEANDFSCGLALVKAEGRYGYINADNRFVIPATYEEAYPFYENRACFLGEEGYGYLDTDGAVAIAPDFELAFDFCEGYAVIKKGKYGLIDIAGNIVLEPTWEQLSPQVKGGLLKARKNGKWVLINTEGTVLTEEYLHIGDFSEGLCPVKTETGYGYINEAFELLIPAIWEFSGDFSDGYAVVSENGLFGYVDTVGTQVTAIKYIDALRVSQDKAAVMEEGTGYYFIRLSEQSFSPDVEGSGFVTLPQSGTLILKIGYNFMNADGDLIPLDAAPVLYEDYTMLPIRQVVEAIGGTVDWEPETRKISMSYLNHSVVMYLDEAGAFVDGRFLLMPVPPMIMNDRTLIPLRFATESLGCEVDWIPDSQEILICY